jgi:hypothetical protein
MSLTAGFLLNPGDRVDTRNGGRVVIALSDGSMVVVEPWSMIQFKDFRQAESLRELFEIGMGKVRVKVNHFVGRPNPYRMNSPTASIAVRGTEFSIEVGEAGATAVMVYEGTVRVAKLSDPNQAVLLDAGQGVLVQAGQDLQLLGAASNPGGGQLALDQRGERPKADLPQAANLTGPGGLYEPSGQHGDRDVAVRATPSAYDSYMSGLSDLTQAPFLLRFNAFAEATYDSLENPAFATQFKSPEARFTAMPTFGGGPDLDNFRSLSNLSTALPGDYSLTPQFSIFTPIGHSNVFLGGNLSASHITDSSVLIEPDGSGASAKASADHTSGSSSSRFLSGSLVAARRFGSTSVGLGLELMRGAGGLSNTYADMDSQVSVEQVFAVSKVRQTRVTAGVTHSFGARVKLGAYYRYGWISASDFDLIHTIDDTPAGLDSSRAAGHSSDVGVRLRGVTRSGLFYGISGAWNTVSLNGAIAQAGAGDSGMIDRGRRTSAGAGLGYSLLHRFVFALDGAAGTSRASSFQFDEASLDALQNATASRRFFSAHAALEATLSKRLFASASFLNVWHGERLSVNPSQSDRPALDADPFLQLTPSPYSLAPRFSDFSLGWRFSPVFFVRYMLTTSYGSTPPSHVLALRYLIHLRNSE